MRATSSGRLRLVVVQALVFSLFATLFVRLYYLQVVGGESYQAQAANQSVRDIVVQPQRGLIVDDQGRPLVTNRTSWVVSVDRTLLGKLAEGQRTELLRRVAVAVEVEPQEVQDRLVTCGDPGSIRDVCWNGSPYQPVPVATDVSKDVALRVLEQPEDYPGVLAEQQNVRSYPRPYGINLAHVLGYLSPITEEEYDLASEKDDRSLNGASVVGRAGVEKQYDEWLRGLPGYRRVAVDSMGRVLGDDSIVESTPGDTLVTSIDAKVQGVVERQLARAIRTQRGLLDTVTGRNYVADAGAAVVLEARTGRVVAMASQPTYDPGVWVGGITSKAAGPPLLREGRHAAALPRHPGPVRARLHVEALHDRRRAEERLSAWTPPCRAPRASRWATGSSRTTSPAPTATSASRRRSPSPATPSSTASATASGSASAPTSTTSMPVTRWSRRPRTSASGSAPASTSRARPPAGSPTGPGSAPTTSRMKDFYCDLADKPQTKDTSDFVYKFAREFCIEGYAYRAGDAVNFSIGQGDTIVTPLQLARAYAALSNGGTLYAPHRGEGDREPRGQGAAPHRAPQGRPGRRAAALHPLHRPGSAGRRAPGGTMNWKLLGFPLDKVKIRAKTGSAEVYGKQSTGWVASYTEDYVVVMMISQGGTGSGSTGDAIRKIWETLYGVEGRDVRPDKAAIPGTVQTRSLPVFIDDGSIMPPVVADDEPRPALRPAAAASGPPASTGCS